MADVYRQCGSSLIGVEKIPDEMTSSYGVVGVKVNARGQKVIHTMVEKPAPEDAPSRLGVVGRYILDSSIFDYLREIPAGAGGEIQLTDGIAAMLKTHPVIALPFEGERYDCGSRHGYIKATIDYALDHAELREGMLDHMLLLLRNSGRI
jgi:UTP--glucose-1-phosphate uridylyltransferase